MVKRLFMIVALATLVLGMAFAPITTVTAQEDIAEESEEGIDPDGPGIVILMFGVVAIAGVGFAYWSRETNSGEPKQSA